MKILELYIKNFGRYQNETIVFGEGINVIYGENEAGKSTIYAFIKAMLFGLERGRGRASLNDTFSQYEPWDNPNYYAGRMRFVCGDRTFSLERSFDKYGKNAYLICEDDGEVLSVENGDLDILLDGMDEAAFENTSAIGQLKVETGAELAAELKNYAANYYLTGNGDLNLEKALSYLGERKKELEKTMKEIVRKRQEKREALEQEASYLWRDIHRFKSEMTELEEELQLRKKEKEAAAPETETVQKWRVHPGEVVSLFILVILAFILIPRPWNALVGIVIFLADGIYIWNRMKEGRKKRPEQAKEEPLTEEEKRESYERLVWKKTHLLAECKEKEVAYSNLQEQIKEQELTGEEYTRQEKTRKSVELARERLQEQALGIHKELSADLDRKASAILKEVTDEKYERLFIDEELKMSIYSKGRRIPAERVSRGTIEQLYLALRMASLDVLYAETFPVILDDTFVFYDERRLESTLCWFYRNKEQVLLFTCQKREAQIFNKLEIPYTHIQLKSKKNV